MRVLVTGGAGYVGYSLVGKLAASSAIDDVVVYDNLARGEHSLFFSRMGGGRVRFVRGDILDGRSLARALEGVDAVFHLAAAVHAPGRDSEAHVFDQVNNWGSAQLAACVEDAPSVRDLIYVSSVAVYGSSPDEFDTDTTPRPSSFYGVTKLRGEGHVRRLATDDRRVVVVRAGNVFGFNPAMRFDGVINRFVLDARHSGRIHIEGSGDQTRPFVSVDLLAEALVRLLGSGLPTSLLNVVQESRSVLDVAEAVREIDASVELLFVDQDIRMEQLRVAPSPELHELVGQAEPDLSDGIKELWQALEI